MKNEGPVERGMQTVISAALMLSAIFWLDGIWVWVAGIFSIAILAFASIGFCPLYAVFKIKKNENEK
ncbi:MAG: DUF2892 domain-containing protein [Candidatus Moranbacteria bacterium]|nr:DUF2892 domain-containing protein [bacterium]MDP1834074.1 DUF2892 domain-containing protein [Candidatus Moranbacteria bacterium]